MKFQRFRVGLADPALKTQQGQKQIRPCPPEIFRHILHLDKPWSSVELFLLPCVRRILCTHCTTMLGYVLSHNLDEIVCTSAVNVKKLISLKFADM